jgi:hypothetical protein
MDGCSSRERLLTCAHADNDSIFCFLIAGFSLNAADLYFDLTDKSNGGLPANFESVLGGQGKPGKWIIREDEVPVTSNRFLKKLSTPMFAPYLRKYPRT